MVPLVLAAALLGAAPAEASANVASVSVSTSANPTQGVPVSVSVSGTTQLQRSLYVYVEPYDNPCASTPYSAASGATALANGTSIGPESFSGSYSFTPGQANQSYRICAYVDDTTYNTADAKADAAFTPAVPVSYVHIAASPATAFGAVIPIRVSTNAPVGEGLNIQVCSNADSCSPLTPADGQPVGAGPQVASFSYTPPLQLRAISN